MRTDGLRGAHVFLDEASVTGTENAIMAAVLARGETVIGNAACEPHVQDLCRFLVTLGARIEGIGSNVLRIEGRTELTGGEYRIGCDHIEVASFIGLGAITSGEIVIEEVEPADLVAVMPTFDRLGIRMQVEGRTVRVPDGQELEIRAGMAMLLASLCAEGSSTIGNIGEIDRGYERIDERLRGLGAHVERVEA